MAFNIFLKTHYTEFHDPTLSSTSVVSTSEISMTTIYVNWIPSPQYNASSHCGWR